MKIDNAEKKNTDFRVWCEYCSIRIAPHEEKIAVDDKTYHHRCYSKRAVPVSEAKASSNKKKSVSGDAK